MKIKITLEKEHILLGMLILAIGVLFWSSLSFREIFQYASDFVAIYIDNNPILAALIFIGLGAIAVIISPFSSAPLVPLVVPIWGETLTIFLLVLGWIIGGVGVYIIGSFLGSPLLSHNATLEKVNFYRARISKKAEFGLVLLFRFAIPSEIAGYVLGIIRYQFIKYIIATLIYEIFSAATLVYLSDALVSGRPLYFIVFLAIILIVTGASLYALRRKIRNHFPA